ncbi:MAG: 2-hydroxyacyl-CoA dehydratase subunit D [Desulfomonilia bacterium]
MDRPKIGWFCTYTPIEIIEAAGLTPYGIREDSGKAYEDVYLGDSMCSYVRSCLGGALSGAYDFLDGVVIAHSCECMRRLYDAWLFKQEEIKPKRVFFLDVPRVKSEPAMHFFAKQIERLKEEMEACYGEISRTSLINAINTSNRTRELIARLNETRKKDYPPITGSEVAQLIKKGMAAPGDRFNQELEELLAGLNGKSGDMDRPRVLVYAGPAYGRLIESVEEAGGIVVCEHMCNGLRQFGKTVERDDDPILELSRRYLEKPPCPRMIGEHSMEGLFELKRLVDEFKVDGIIYCSVKFCSNMQAGWPLFKEELQAGVPMKFLEGDMEAGINEREVQSFIKKLARRR